MIFFSFLLWHCSCWWANAHVIIAKNAEKYLTSKQIENINSLISSFNLPQQTLTTCAAWQDDLLLPNMLTIMSQWHYSDTPYVVEPLPKPTPNPTYNVSSYLQSAWKTMTNPTTTDRWTWSFHLRSLIHFVGDIHTPHHNIGRFSKQFPDGDMGGNLYTITCEYGSSCQNIHFLWDSVGRVYPIADPTLPYYTEDVIKNASLLEEEYPFNTFTNLTDVIDIPSWAAESNQIARELGYSTPMDEPPSDQYMTDMRKAAKRRVAMAGYRLGNMLKILSDNGLIPEKSHQTASSREIILWIVDVIAFVVIVIFGFLLYKGSAGPPQQFEKLL